MIEIEKPNISVDNLSEDGKSGTFTVEEVHDGPVVDDDLGVGLEVVESPEVLAVGLGAGLGVAGVGDEGEVPFELS